MIRRPLVPVALVLVVLVAANARGEELAPVPNAVQQPEEPLRRTPLRTTDPDHLAPGHSDLGLEVGEYFAGVGMQLAATAVVLIVSVPIVISSLNHGDMSRQSFHEMITVMTFLSPLILSVPSSLLSHKMSQRCARRSHSWGYAFLAGVATSAAVAWAAALLTTGSYGSSRSHSGAAFWVLLGGALLPPAAEVLTLHLTSTEVAAAPLLLQDGAGVALGLRF